MSEIIHRHQAAGVPEPLEPLLATPEGTLWGVRVEPVELRDRLERLRSQGLTAFVLGGGEDLSQHRDIMVTAALQTIDAMLAGAQEVHASLRAGVPVADVFEGVRAPAEAVRMSMEESRGEAERSWEFGALEIARRAPGEVMSLAVTDAPDWHAPALLRVGGVNEHPRAFAHAGLLRWWMEEWRARVVTLTQDLVELDVGRRPKGMAEAFALASEHHTYCPQVVEGSNLMAYARELRERCVWSFAWGVSAPDDADEYDALRLVEGGIRD